MRLTDLSVRALPVSERQKIHFDDSLPNFGVRVSAKGTRSWVVALPGNRSVRTLGRYPAMSLKDARAAARRALIEPPTEPRASSYNGAVSAFLAESEKRLAASTYESYRRYLAKHWRFGERSLAEITPQEVRAIVASLEEKPAAQNYAFAAFRAFMNWAVRNQLLAASPAASLRAPAAAKSRERILSDDELGAVYRHALEHRYPYGPMVQLLILTGQRRSEIAGLKWEWIDLEEKLVTFPAEAVKNRTRHFLPLGEIACTVLKKQPRLSGYVFAARGTRSGEAAPFSGWSKAKASFDQELEGVEPYTLHDLRRSFASNLAKLGTPVHVTEKLLNHKSGVISGVAAVYNRYDYLRERREAVRKLEALVLELAKKARTGR